MHKKKISACLITLDEHGLESHEIREFGTFTADLLEMKEWLKKNGCPILAMESTGVYWRPVHNVLEESMEVIIVNARQRIVDFVGHARGKPPNREHFLALDHHLLHAYLFRDIIYTNDSTRRKIHPNLRIV